MTAYRQKRKAPPGQKVGQATGGEAGDGAPPRSSLSIIAQSRPGVKCDAGTGAVHLILRLNERPQVCIDAMQESDALALLPLAERARRLAALVGVTP